MAGTPGQANWDASRVTVVFGSIIVDGYADGEGLSVEFNEDAFSLTVGIDGKAVRNKILNRSARVTLNLLASSATNDALNAVYQLDQVVPNGAGVAPLAIRDHNGRSLLTSPAAWIARPPDFTVDQEAGTRTWIIDCNPLDSFVGGL